VQIAASMPFRKRLWQQLVRQKILNQSMTLARVDPASALTLRAMARQTRSGDPSNVEARAARFYWSRLFAEFRREGEDRRNAMLNYGYAVLRAAIARSLVAHGFLPAIGIHHDGAQNPFNLADDVIEPFRPFADRVALARWDDVRADAETSLTLQDRQVMAAVLTMDAASGDEQVPILTAIDLTVASLQRAFAGGDPEELRLPEPSTSEDAG
jgi:CRISPR-associated protein Cas1